MQQFDDVEEIVLGVHVDPLRDRPELSLAELADEERLYVLSRRSGHEAGIDAIEAKRLLEVPFLVQLMVHR